jgi:hypothetical protein
VQVLEATESIDNKMEQVVDGAQRVFELVSSLILMTILLEKQREKLQTWLSPPDPSVNYNTARDAYHGGTAAWFTQDHTFRDWKASGSESFLWIHGKRKFLSSLRLFTLADACPPWLNSRFG